MVGCTAKGEAKVSSEIETLRREVAQLKAECESLKAKLRQAAAGCSKWWIRVHELQEYVSPQ